MKQLLTLLLISALFVQVVAGCSGWKVVGHAPDESDRGRVRVTLEDGNTVELRDSYAKGDTLYGMGPGSSFVSTRGKKQSWDAVVTIPLQRIAKIEQKDIGSEGSELLEQGVEAGDLLTAGKKIRITVPDERLFKRYGKTAQKQHIGRYIASAGGRVAIEPKGGSEDTLWIPTQRILRTEVLYGRNHHGVRGAAIGVGVGALLGLGVAAIVVPSCEGEFLCGAAYILFPAVGAGGGLFIGGITGIFFGSDRWIEVPQDRVDVGLIVQPDGRPGVGLRLRF